uniref:Uncharacterized protein n=1 Tax=Glossina palpalis gambiensis TaxID=67801 RepID=A0A1B0AXT4_9MUSC
MVRISVGINDFGLCLVNTRKRVKRVIVFLMLRVEEDPLVFTRYTLCCDFSRYSRYKYLCSGFPVFNTLTTNKFKHELINVCHVMQLQ